MSEINRFLTNLALLMGFLQLGHRLSFLRDREIQLLHHVLEQFVHIRWFFSVISLYHIVHWSKFLTSSAPIMLKSVLGSSSAILEQVERGCMEESELLEDES